MDREALAWAGGFYSGEGSTGLSKQNRYWYTHKGERREKKSWKIDPQMQICQADSPETLIRFGEAIGNLGALHGPYGPYSTQKKPYYQYQLYGFEKVQAVVAMLWPFLSTAKQEQAADVLERYLKQ